MSKVKGILGILKTAVVCWMIGQKHPKGLLWAPSGPIKGGSEIMDNFLRVTTENDIGFQLKVGAVTEYRFSNCPALRHQAPAEPFRLADGS